MKKLLLIILGMLMISCTVTKEVPVEVEKIKTEYKTQHDSVFIQDSIYIDRFTKNDTVFMLTYKTKLKYKTKIDTLIETDTIYQPTYIKTTVTKTKYKWDWMLGCGLIGILIGGFLGLQIKRSNNDKTNK